MLWLADRISFTPLTACQLTKWHINQWLFWVDCPYLIPMHQHVCISCTPLHSRTHELAPHLQFARGCICTQNTSWKERKERKACEWERERVGLSPSRGSFKMSAPEIDELELSACTESCFTLRSFNRESMMVNKVGREHHKVDGSYNLMLCK